ncbi:uncharacterized protein LOC132060371 [Lycium ferocissimum]|uniref:uncharacterized protein LOC132060371 n=1 Tax=Lycium ferocissimum TaxID=112874 RepID=UPI00281546C6|nr:uncharacterized protein LOC132060371 [Lycium ferocissimum]
MDGVGARLGRSSARYAPTTVFTGPVRKWKKKWIHGTPLSSGNNHNRTTTNGVNGSNGSHLLLFKWIPITASQNNNGTTEIKNDDVSVEETPKRKFKYIPLNVLEEQKNEASEEAEDDIKPIETDTNSEEPTSQADDDDKPDINDVPMEESQAPQKRPPERQDLNERTLDLSLG